MFRRMFAMTALPAVAGLALLLADGPAPAMDAQGTQAPAWATCQRPEF